PHFVAHSDGPLNFGSVCIGQSATRGLTVGNDGTGNLSVSAINITHPYSVSSPGVPFSVAPNATPVPVTLRFSPDSPGPTLNTGFTIFTNDPGTPFANGVLFGKGLESGEFCSDRTRCCGVAHPCGGCLGSCVPMSRPCPDSDQSVSFDRHD